MTKISTQKWTLTVSNWFVRLWQSIYKFDSQIYNCKLLTIALQKTYKWYKEFTNQLLDQL